MGGTKSPEETAHALIIIAATIVGSGRFLEVRDALRGSHDLLEKHVKPLQRLGGVDAHAIAVVYEYTKHGLGASPEHLVRRLMEGAGVEYRNEGERETGRVAPKREEAEEILASRPEHMREFLELVVG